MSRGLLVFLKLNLRSQNRYIMMYIDNVVTQDNIPYVYHLALKLKTVRDSESDEYDNVCPTYYSFPYCGKANPSTPKIKNLYLLSELSQHLLKARAHTQGWAIPTQPESPKMPGDIFRPLGPEEANKVRFLYQIGFRFFFGSDID